MTKEQLLAYCKAHDIFVPAEASKEYLHAAIVRAAHHKGQVESPTCFGYWEYQNMTCEICDLEKECFKASMGMDKDEFFKKLEAAENPRIRFVDKKLRK